MTSSHQLTHFLNRGCLTPSPTSSFSAVYFYKARGGKTRNEVSFESKYRALVFRESCPVCFWPTAVICVLPIDGESVITINPRFGGDSFHSQPSIFKESACLGRLKGKKGGRESLYPADLACQKFKLPLSFWGLICCGLFQGKELFELETLGPK